MIHCEICGIDFGEGVEVVVYGRTHRFHSFACAIKALAPRCEHCQRGIVGRGPQSSGYTLCCDRCADDHRNRKVAGFERHLPHPALPARNSPDPLPALQRGERAGAEQVVLRRSGPAYPIHTMNSVLTKPLVVPQEAVVAPPFKVTILYECLDTGKHAKRFSDQLMAAAELEQPLTLELWNFCVLGLRETRNAAASAAAVADMVVFAMSGNKALPVQVERWIEMWTWLMDGSKPAVVALFSTPQAQRARIQTYLRGVAASKGLGFFPQMIGGLVNARRGEEIAARECSTSDRLGSMHHLLSRRV